MDVGRYIDFVGHENPNTVYCFYEDKNAPRGYSFGKNVLSSIVAGDSDSAYISIPYLGEEYENAESYVEFADIVLEELNASYPPFLEFAFNCPPERNDSMLSEREVVSDKSLFLSKKRYIMHVVDSEGKRVDKLKIMGVELKKSDTSKAIKKLLMDLVLAILDGVEGDDLLSLVADMRAEFNTFQASDIAKPINVKTLKKCQDSYDITGSMKGFPYQVRAAMFWNELCGVSDKKIMPGEKVGLLYIKHPQSKYIAFPIDMTVFPDWFHELTVDYQTEWSKAHAKLENYLASIGMDVAGRKNAIKEELFGF